MLKLGIALSNKEQASLLVEHLTKDELFDITDISLDNNTFLDSSLEHYDLMLIDKKLVSKKETESPRGIFPLKKSSGIDDISSRLYQLGFNYSQGTDFLAEIIYDCYENRSKKFILKKSYEKLAKKYSTQPDKIKWSVMSSFRMFQSYSDRLDNFSGLKEFVWWITNS